MNLIASPFPEGPAAFDTVADVYDRQPNPLLALEERILGPMLPPARGLDVLDAGCGTGRWLHHLSRQSPRSLAGFDPAPRMLLEAEAKLGPGCDLRLGSCTAIPFESATADLVLASFVISYVNDLETFALEVDRVARPGAPLFLSDMHPVTQASLQWKRSFSNGASRVEIEANGWSLEQIKQVFLERGFELISLAEPAVGVEEGPIFEECGRPDLYELAAAHPAIFVLQMRKPPSRSLGKAARKTPGSICLTGARCALGPDAAATASVSIAGKYIHSVRDRSATEHEHQDRPDFFSEFHLDLSGYLLLPGLVNAHDHLEFSLFPNLGNGPYQNASHWASDIQRREVLLIERHRRVPKEVRLEWGAVRNLLSGVTTVCHHNPITSTLMGQDFPVRVVSDFSWAHSLSLEPNLAGKFVASRPDLPFIVHAGEGVDETSKNEVFELDRLHVLDQRTVLVHGLACTPAAVSLINQRLAAVILCPTSNQFLFRRAPSLNLIRSFDTVALGSDSPLTAAGDLLNEIHFVHSRLDLDASIVYGMVTNQAADILRLRQGEGRLWPGSGADLLVVRDQGLTPAETIVHLTLDQIEMVMVAGRVRLVKAALFDRLPHTLREGMELLEVDGQTLWLRAPVCELLVRAGNVLGSDLRLGGKRVRRASAA
jgi:cytosine/adenosine deaminase-related metal-dependent hydrolase/ubiquinone/menaquinone biosynthesis C-methylase UbiE